MGFTIPGLSNIALCLFIFYIGYSIWTMVLLFIPPDCKNPKLCLKPLIEEKPVMQFAAFTSVKQYPEKSSDLTLIYQQSSFDFYAESEAVINVNLPRKVRNNGSMHMHLFMTSPNVDVEHWAALIEDELTVYASVPLTQYQVPESLTFNLLGDKSTNDSSNASSSQKSSDKPKESSKTRTHFQTVITFYVLTQPVLLPRDDIPYEIGRELRLNSMGKYLPLMHIDLLSYRIKDLHDVTSNLLAENVTVKYTPISYGKMRMWLQFEGSLHSLSLLGFSSKDIDEVKGIFSDSNTYLLLATFLVAALHLLFDFLSFKNDINFWRNIDSTGGISPSTIAWRAFAQIIIFLYLFEEGTSMLVLAPAGIGVFIELWKVCKTFHIRLKLFERPRFRGFTREENLAKQLDSEGLVYLSFVMVPLCISGAVYSLINMPHKSWYSWILNSLVNGVYAFGFLFMMPQLFINYKLKSVAHLPWRAFMYKAFNTFIDDLFAFIITMPTAHRIACFRDDIVFVIYLYQRWLYPVDKKRLNEGGQVVERKSKKEKKH